MHTSASAHVSNSPAALRTEGRARRLCLLPALGLLGALALPLLQQPAQAGTSGRLQATDETPDFHRAAARARAALKGGRFADAYGRYAALADSGDPAAASIALALVLNGRPLFGSDWSATPGQLGRWQALAQQHYLDRKDLIADHPRGE